VTLLLSLSFAINLNEFFGDVDIYDDGQMGKGKNSGGWYHSLERQEEAFYFLGMQPWRHFIHTYVSDGEVYTDIINEDYSNATVNGVLQRVDYCQKTYGYPFQKYEIDWDAAEKVDYRIPKVDINGMTCYEYPGKFPLDKVYLNNKYTQDSVDNPNVCRFTYIGGKSITFRSFSAFTSNTQFQADSTGKFMSKWPCNKAQYPAYTPNVESTLSIIYGINEAAAKQKVGEVLNTFVQKTGLTTDNLKGKITVYWMTADSYKSVDISLQELATKNFNELDVASRPVDLIISTARNDMIAKMTQQSVKRGDILILTDKRLQMTYNATEDFDPFKIVVNVVALNQLSGSEGVEFRKKAQNLVSLGEMYHEFNDVNKIEEAVVDSFRSMKSNFTERCDKQCKGFCDAANRCICPMCCEDTCFYSYCDVTHGECKQWPEGKPRAKIHCEETCAATYKCVDKVGCVPTYKTGCQPTKCKVPVCNNGINGAFTLTDNCGQDERPGVDGYCRRYKCDEEQGCIEAAKGEYCVKTSPCDDVTCDSNLKCVHTPKKCVMASVDKFFQKCYEAKCNVRTGMCETSLKCSHYAKCGGDDVELPCSCTENGDCQCKTDGIDKAHLCEGDEVCDYINGIENAKCIKSNCTQDLKVEGCEVMVCNNDTKTVEKVPINCSSALEKAVFLPVESSAITIEKCKNKFTTKCSLGNCEIVLKEGESLSDGCGECSYTYDSENKRYNIYYEEACGKRIGACGQEGYCSNGQCVYKQKTGQELKDHCIQCIGAGLFCPKDPLAYRYTHNYLDDSCSVDINETRLKEYGTCNYCDKNGVIQPTCTDKEDFEKNYTLPDGRVIKYKIEHECNAGHCVPKKEFKCECSSGNPYRETYLKEVCDALTHHQEVECTTECDYRSEYVWKKVSFDTKKWRNEQEQVEAFYNNINDSQCTWTLRESDCHTCKYSGDHEGYFDYTDDCPDEQDGVPYRCSGKLCIVDESYSCQPKNCIVRKVKMGAGDDNCENVTDSNNNTVYMCQKYIDELDNKRANIRKQEILYKKYIISFVDKNTGKLVDNYYSYTAPDDERAYRKCGAYECKGDTQCTMVKDIKTCVQQTGEDYGCRRSLANVIQLVTTVNSLILIVQIKICHTSSKEMV